MKLKPAKKTSTKVLPPVRVTEDEYAAIKKRADDLGTTLSELVRQASLKWRPTKADLER